MVIHPLPFCVTLIQVASVLCLRKSYRAAVRHYSYIFDAVLWQDLKKAAKKSQLSSRNKLSKSYIAAAVIHADSDKPFL
jgi:hypothetical protein